MQEVNRVVKQYQDMARMMKKMGSKAGAAGLKAMLGGGTGNPSGMLTGTGLDINAMAKQFSPPKSNGLVNPGGLPPGINPNRKK